ncbi:DUF4406 domain-containing protein [Alicyclobacillus vulcanalis]|uniref:Nucleoside 2-deoxyribosyltransferase n=1 Tax=Alicyclobacillus vulcanalis TaxID=252246 RepID=A0A1N7MDC9_9BACL|nr:DUF4406 domain-containing protein [Alicyclobacillus vulcanalis]SIS84094.1 protein of unknown function [Alicyclobacillus vulcanalis]
MKRVYLSGPMTGLPQGNRPAFLEAARALRAHGIQVLNPAEFGSADDDWYAAMRRDLRMLMDADAVVTLPGWERSRGARLEVYVASQLNMPVYTLAACLRTAAEAQAQAPAVQLSLGL